MNIEFISVNRQNIETVSKLHIAKSQAGMVETVEECFSEAEEFSLWRPTAIGADGDLIGFAMYGLWKNEGENGRVWLDRFFIDERYQGKGYAKIVLKALLERITEEYECKEIYLSVYKNNVKAIHLYQEFDFSFNGEFDINGEEVMKRADVGN